MAAVRARLADRDGGIVNQLVREPARELLQHVIGGCAFAQPLARAFQLLRLRIDPTLGLVPEISGNRLMVSVRLMKQDNERMQASSDSAPFELTLCA